MPGAMLSYVRRTAWGTAVATATASWLVFAVLALTSAHVYCFGSARFDFELPPDPPPHPARIAKTTIPPRDSAGLIRTSRTGGLIRGYRNLERSYCRRPPTRASRF